MPASESEVLVGRRYLERGFLDAAMRLFVLTLALALVGDDSTERDDAESQRLWKVLIVDDDHQIHAVTKMVLSSARSPTAQFSRGCWAATAATIRCNRLCAVASADSAPASAPPAEAMALSVPTPGGACAGVGVGSPPGWRTTVAAG